MKGVSPSGRDKKWLLIFSRSLQPPPQGLRCRVSHGVRVSGRAGAGGPAWSCPVPGPLLFGGLCTAGLSVFLTPQPRCPLTLPLCAPRSLNAQATYSSSRTFPEVKHPHLPRLMTCPLGTAPQAPPTPDASCLHTSTATKQTDLWLPHPHPHRHPPLGGSCSFILQD